MPSQHSRLSLYMIIHKDDQRSLAILHTNLFLFKRNSSGTLRSVDRFPAGGPRRFEVNRVCVAAICPCDEIDAGLWEASDGSRRSPHPPQLEHTVLHMHTSRMLRFGLERESGGVCDGVVLSRRRDVIKRMRMCMERRLRATEGAHN
jgi:hypothetical protein